MSIRVTPIHPAAVTALVTPPHPFEMKSDSQLKPVAATPTPRHWPRDLPRTLLVPNTPIYRNLELSAARYPDQPAVHFFGTDLNYTEFHDQVRRITGWLTRRANVKHGDRVLMLMQNSPQWLIAYYGILGAGAIVVPVNPMNRASELQHYLKDSGATVAVCAQELLPQLEQGASGTALTTIIRTTYSDYLLQPHDYELPDWVTAPRTSGGDCADWADVIAANERPIEVATSVNDVAGLFYTSGSTGAAKGCLLTNAVLMHNIVGQALWHWTAPGTRVLGSSPMFHVSGLNHGVHMPIYVGGASVVLPRWNGKLAAQLIERQRIGHATIPPTALRDLLATPGLENLDLSSLRRLTAGGAAMPESLAGSIRERLGVEFIEAYGLTETCGTTHLNPIMRPKRASLGIPFFGTESLIVDPETLHPVAQGESGEILVMGPQVFSEYWNRPADTAAAFVEIDGKRFFRTGDIGTVDEDGYYFITDRAKRMINASGYKVWPAEVETALYQHPEIREVCVIGTADPYRGETVKAVVVRQPGTALDRDNLIAWARTRLAAYKCPTVVEFVDDLPKSNVGKILWKELQDAEKAKAPAAAGQALPTN